MNREGAVVAVCLSNVGGIPKYPQDSATIGQYGVEGDYHPGEFDKKGRPNTRHVTIVSREAINKVARILDVTIPPGGLGENILVDGLGDLAEVEAGQRLLFSSGVELEITGQNDPCNNLSVYHRLAVKHLYGRRGLLAVVRGVGPLAPGDRVTVTS